MTDQRMPERGLLALLVVGMAGCGFDPPVRSFGNDGGMAAGGGTGAGGPPGGGGTGAGGSGDSGGGGSIAGGAGGSIGRGGGGSTGRGSGGSSAVSGSGGLPGGSSGGTSGGGACIPLACDGAAGPCPVRLPAVFRDFNGRGSAGAHPDFQPGYAAAGALQGLVQPELDAEGKPSLAAAATATNGYLHGQAAFAQWYRDVSGVNARVAGEIVLWGDGSGRYVNRWGASGEPWLAYSNITWCGSTDCAACGPPPEGQMCAAPCPNSLFGPVCFATKVLYDGNPLFFPVDSAPGILSELRIAAQVPEQYGFMGWPTEASVATALGQTTPVATATAPFPSATHNFSFTTEVRVWFRYDATRPARIEINGDDDIWAFLNGHLAIDLGGWHVPLDGSVALDGGTITSSATLTLGFSPVTTVKSAAAFGLEHGRVYSLAVFHAERQTSGSALRVAVSGLDLLQGPCSP